MRNRSVTRTLLPSAALVRGRLVLAAGLAIAGAAAPLPARAQDGGDPEARGVPAPAGSAFEIGGRLYTRWTLADDPDEPLDAFSLSSARIQVEWRPETWVEAVVEVEAEGLADGGGVTDLLRDAYIELAPLRWLEVRAGRFKRPFSQIELLPLRRIPAIGRGAANRWVVDRLAYGGRDVGLQIGGRLWDDARLDYAVGVFNGTPTSLVDRGLDGFKDFSARLDARPLRWLSAGLSFSLKVLEDADLPALVDPAVFPAGYDEADFRRDHAWMIGATWMTGADLRIRVADLQLLVEASFGENWWFDGQPHTATVGLIASYRIYLPPDGFLVLEPVVRGELAIPRIDHADERLWSASAGVNLCIGPHVRVMVGGEFQRTEGRQPDETAAEGLWPGEWPGSWDDRNRLIVQLAFDT
jgi:hypothetical protein